MQKSSRNKPNNTIYLIPGFGADDRIFQYFDFPSDDIQTVEWLTPLDVDEPFSAYAQRLIDTFIDTPNPILIGVSLGGIMAIEIAKLIPVKQVLLISSIKNSKERPFLFRFAKATGLYRLAQPWILKHFSFFGYVLFLGFPRGYSLFREMIFKTEDAFVHWGIKGVVHWENETVIPNLVHIHGNIDLIFPVMHLSNYISIKGGTHGMVGSKAKEISSCIRANYLS